MQIVLWKIGLAGVGAAALLFVQTAHAQCQPQTDCDNAMAALNSQSLPGSVSNQNINGNSDDQKGALTSAAGNNYQAAAACKKANGQCQSSCQAMGASVVQQCQQKTQANQQTAQKNGDDLTSKASQASNSGNNSNGMPMMLPPMPSPSPAPDPTPAPTAQTPAPTPTPAAAAVAAPAPAPGVLAPVNSCTGDLAYLDSSCTGQLETQCAGKYKSTGVCDSFSSRYCSGSGDSGQASSGAMKTGTGIGTSFCTGYLSQTSSFQCTSATASCPSCTNTPPVAGAPVPTACMNDPAYANPSVAAATTGASTGAGGGSSSSGGSPGGMSGLTAAVGGAAGASNAIPGAPAAKGQGSAEGMSLGTAGGGGGGGEGFGSHMSLSDLESSMMSPHNRSSASTARAPTSVAAVTDVEMKKTANVFSISSEVLRSRCDNGKLLHCVAKKK